MTRVRTGLVAILMLTAQGAAAQDLQLGRIEFMGGCAQCHGVDAMGDGVIARYLTQAPPDLTRLARDNGGTYPADSVRTVIVSGGGVGPHGSSDMPAWGNRYAAEAPWLLGLGYTAAERDAFIAERIEALVAYVETLQVP